MTAIHVTHEVTINHRELGRETWEWADEEQALFLTGLAEVFRADAGVGLLQLSYMTDKLRRGTGNIDAVRWFNDHLTEYLKEEA